MTPAEKMEEDAIRHAIGDREHKVRVGASTRLAAPIRSRIYNAIFLRGGPITDSDYKMWVGVSRDYFTQYAPFERTLMEQSFWDSYYMVKSLHQRDRYFTTKIHKLETTVKDQAARLHRQTLVLADAMKDLAEGDRKRRRTASDVDAEQTAVFDALCAACDVNRHDIAAASARMESD